MALIQQIESADFFIEKDLFTGAMGAMHHHASLELYYLVKGEREYFIEDAFFKLTEGDMVLIPQNLLHRTAGKGASRFLVYFSEALLQKFFTEGALAPLLSNRPCVFRPDETERARISMIFSSLLSEYTRAEREQSPPSEPLVAGYLYQLLFTMTYGNNTYVPHEYADERIAQVVRYINENYNHITDIEEIAEHFFISKFHLCRIFNKNLGIPLVTYLNTIKIREACTLIKEGHLNLTEIAIRCGFNSSSYFCKVFKSEKGLSPTEYKKQQRKTAKV
jgi:AraC-like DNA-binding protein